MNNECLNKLFSPTIETQRSLLTKLDKAAAISTEYQIPGWLKCREVSCALPCIRCPPLNPVSAGSV